MDWASWVQMRHESHLPPALKTVLEMWLHQAPSPDGHSQWQTLAAGFSLAGPSTEPGTPHSKPGVLISSWPRHRAHSTLGPLRSRPTDSFPSPPPSGHLAAFGSWNTAFLTLCPLPGIPLAPSHLCIPLRGAPHPVTAPPGVNSHCFLTLPTDGTLSESRSHI